MLPDSEKNSAVDNNAEAVLRRLEWTVLRRLQGLIHGNYRSFFRGFGLDLADLREYQFNDEVRHIDWNVTARLQVPYVREYNEDREITAWFLLDMSPSVDFGSGEEKKCSILAEFVAVLARLLTQHGNHVGALIYNDGVEAVIPPRSSRTQVLHILDRLLNQPKRDKNRQQSMTDLGELLHGAGHILKRRSLVFVVSDFISEPGWDDPLFQLTIRHEVLGVRLYDPLEMELPDIGFCVMQDAETGEQIFVDTHDSRFRARFMEVAERRERELRNTFQEAGVDVLELSTEDDLVDAIIRFADLRKHKTQLSSGGVPPHMRGFS